MALHSTGTSTLWGNINGQLNAPAGLSGVTAIAAGAAHSMALLSDGTVRVWGQNQYQQSVASGGLANVEAISGGEKQSMALLSDGTVVQWGFSVPPPADMAGVTQIAAG
jgi:alpha-tubulin suppressor-like RCC1 family protein